MTAAGTISAELKQLAVNQGLLQKPKAGSKMVLVDPINLLELLRRVEQEKKIDKFEKVSTVTGTQKRLNNLDKELYGLLNQSSQSGWQKNVMNKRIPKVNERTLRHSKMKHRQNSKKTTKIPNSYEHQTALLREYNRRLGEKRRLQKKMQAPSLVHNLDGQWPEIVTNAYGDSDSEISEVSTSTDEIDDEQKLQEILKSIKGTIAVSAYNRAKALLKLLTVHDSTISWTPEKKELIVNGNQIVRGSNMTDLIIDAVQERQAKGRKSGSPGPPIGFKEFAKQLHSMNIPRHLLRNQRRWKILHSLSVAKTPLSKRKRMRSDTTSGGQPNKRKPSRTVKMVSSSRSALRDSVAATASPYLGSDNSALNRSWESL